VPLREVLRALAEPRVMRLCPKISDEFFVH